MSNYKVYADMVTQPLPEVPRDNSGQISYIVKGFGGLSKMICTYLESPDMWGDWHLNCVIEICERIAGKCREVIKKRT